MSKKQEQKESYLYRMPVGITTNEQQLKKMHKAMLRDQYENMIHQKHMGEQRRKSSQSYNVQYTSLPPSSHEKLSEDMERERNIKLAKLGEELERQISEKKSKIRLETSQQLEKEKMYNEEVRLKAREDEQNALAYREKVRQELQADYKEKLMRKQIQRENHQHEKNLFKKRYSDVNLYAPKRVPRQAKIPAQVENKYKIMKTDEEKKYNHYKEIAEERQKQNKLKQKEFWQYKKQQQLQRQLDLKKALLQQIEEQKKRKQEQRKFDKRQFYEGKFENVYNPLYNPVDSVFSRDNKYVILEMQKKGEKSSSLARNGSLSLL